MHPQLKIIVAVVTLITIWVTVEPFIYLYMRMDAQEHAVTNDHKLPEILNITLFPND